MITRPKTWLVCESCGEWFTEDTAKEMDVCPDCKKGKLYLTCAECGELLDKCKCKADKLK